MARMKHITHSEDACTMTFKGDKRYPEPSMGAITFPGGYVEVSRCSDGSYYAHIRLDENDTEILQSRIDYKWESSHLGVPDIPDHHNIKHIAINVKKGK
jgi:hypothetical protein